MKHIDEFRNERYIGVLVSQINEVSRKIKKEVKLMEVCGTHTMAIARSGLKKTLPENVRLISGPGCPVCVSPNSYIDTAISISELKDIRVATFGDMYRVPSGNRSLEKQAADGAKIDIVYSPLDALKIAEEKPCQEIVFLGVGFETTAPLTARVIQYAKNKGIKNFRVLSGHRLIPPAMQTLVKDLNHEIHGFICPGHVSAIIGSVPYRIFPEKYGIPCVISGFEVIDILHSILMLLEMISGEKKTSVVIQYKRCVEEKGNPEALKIMREIFDVVDAEWRGIGLIESSGLAIGKRYRELDATYIFSTKPLYRPDPKGCLCGEILKGIKKPSECKLFGRLCTPEHPVGPCMVSSEGTCAAYYSYER